VKLEGQRGGALVEFAIVGPIMLMLLVAAVELSWIAYGNHSAGYAAQLGARWASVRGANCRNGAGIDAAGNGLCPVTPVAVSIYVKNQVPGLASDATVASAWSAPPPAWSNAPSNCSAANQAAGCIVTVTVKNTFDLLIPFVYSGRITMTRQSQSVVL
jgi:Flp pilus assembly protein TadG